MCRCFTTTTYVGTVIDVMNASNVAIALVWAHGGTVVSSIANFTSSPCMVLSTIVRHVWMSLTTITHVRTPIDVMKGPSVAIALVWAHCGTVV